MNQQTLIVMSAILALAVAIPSIAAAKTSAPSGTPKDCEANYRDNAHGFNCWKSRKSFPPMHQQQAARGEVKGGRVPSGHSIAGRVCGPGSWLGCTRSSRDDWSLSKRLVNHNRRACDRYL